ncbi:radical SAM protein, partial [Brachyspira murdochii]|uniref:radical SAM protein n=1 Tax=Brachyspira murdochii TaxID=84378 RepID=UPI003003D538
MINFNSEDIQFFGNTNNKVFHINLSLSEYCNYQCSYCAAQVPPANKNSIFLSYEKIIETLNRFFIFDADEYFIVLVGGEPTIHPNFLDIVKYINNINKKIYLYIITNATRNVDYFRILFNNANNIKLILKISIHLEYTKFDHIKEIIILYNKFYNDNTNIIIAFMVHPLLKNEREDFFNKLFILRESYNFNLSVEELQEGENYDIVDSRYTYDDFQWIDKIKLEFNSKYKNNNTNPYINSPYYIINVDNKSIKIDKLEHSIAIRNNKRNFKNMYCCYGANIISIWGNGYAAGGECPIFNRQNIYDDFYDWYNSIGYIKCTLNQCRVQFNDNLPKFRKEEDAKKFIEEYKLKHSNIFIQDAYKQLKNNFIKLEEHNRNILNKEIEKNNIQINMLINSITWWIPVKKWRDNFRNRFNTDQTRPDQTRQENTIK